MIFIKRCLVFVIIMNQFGNFNYFLKSKANYKLIRCLLAPYYKSNQMKFFFTFFFLFIFNQFGYTQSLSGVVEYTIHPLKVEVDNANTKAKMMFAELEKTAKNQTYLLEFSSAVSKFHKKELLATGQLTSEKERLLQKAASTLYGTNSIYFFNKNNSKFIIKDVDGNLFFLNEKLNWNITSETKKIGNYLCYKATSEKVGMDKFGKEKSTSVVAWFAPTLPYAFGPIDFNGLPGLILELQFYKSVYLATKIVVDKNSKNKIELPKGKMTDYNEYQKSFVGKM